MALTASAGGVGNDLVLYTWNFGDGTTATGPTQSHVYGAAGIYPVSVTITTDGVNSVTNLLSVAVNSAQGPSGDPKQFTALKTTLKFNFAKQGQDTLTVSGTLPVQTGVSLAGKSVTVAIGGYQSTLTLGPNGKTGGNATSKIVLSGKAKKGVFSVSPAKFQFTVKKETLLADLASAGFSNNSTPRTGEQLTVPVIVGLDGSNYLTTINVTYKTVGNKAGTKSGSAVTAKAKK